MQERIGPWTLTTDLNQVAAHDSRTGKVYASRVTLFPVGYRVSLKWSGPVPDYVKKHAQSLVKRTAIAVHNREQATVLTAFERAYLDSDARHVVEESRANPQNRRKWTPR